MESRLPKDRNYPGNNR